MRFQSQHIARQGKAGDLAPAQRRFVDLLGAARPQRIDGQCRASLAEHKVAGAQGQALRPQARASGRGGGGRRGYATNGMEKAKRTGGGAMIRHGHSDAMEIDKPV
ncbi:hypothetical protein D3C81_1303280 [compost metagenome]